MNEKVIWDYLYGKINNPYGTAALMGNLYVESRLNPSLLQSSYARKFGMTSDEYTKAVDNNMYLDFVHDSAGYGLAQWTYWSRKEALLSYAKKVNKSVGDLQTQLDFLWEELQSYKTVINALKNAVDIRTTSDIVCTRYERPTDQSEKAKQNRANYAMAFFSEFCEKKTVKKVVVTTDRVNVRLGNGKEFARIFLTNSGSSYEWIATAENGWHAVKLDKQVGWISGEFSKVQ